MIIAWVRWKVGSVGYAVRPYDMLADRRRWFWQPRQRCQNLGGSADVR